MTKGNRLPPDGPVREREHETCQVMTPRSSTCAKVSIAPPSSNTNRRPGRSTARRAPNIASNTGAEAAKSSFSTMMVEAGGTRRAMPRATSSALSSISNRASISARSARSCANSSGSPQLSPRLSAAGKKNLPDSPPADRWATQPQCTPKSHAWTYLTQHRQLPFRVLAPASAADVLREGPYGSAWFAHRDDSGNVTHVEILRIYLQRLPEGRHKNPVPLSWRFTKTRSTKSRIGCKPPSTSNSFSTNGHLGIPSF